ncbi:MAG: hypothetical protein QXR81_08275 [Candidatus Nezhaarchaeales archaeon]
MINELPSMDKKQLKELLLGYRFYEPRLEEKAVDKIINENDFNELKLRLLDLFLGKSPLEQRLQHVMDLKGVGAFITSNLLSAIDSGSIIFHPDVVNGMKELLPEDELRKHHKVADLNRFDINAKEYLRFNEFCKVVK